MSKPIPGIEELLHNGQLFVTARQYRELLAQARVIEDRPDRPIAPIVGDIPVHVVTPGNPVDVGDGRRAACFDGSIYFYAADIDTNPTEYELPPGSLFPRPDVPPPPPVTYREGVQK